MRDLISRFPVGVVAIIFVWGGLLLIAPNGAVPYPIQLIASIIEVFPDTMKQARFTLGIAALSLVGTLLVAWVAAIVSVRFPFLNETLGGVLLVLFIAPIVIFGPILSALYPPFLSASIIAFITIGYPVYKLIFEQLRDASYYRSDLGRFYGSGFWRRFVFLTLPSSFPTMLGAIKFSIPWVILGAMLGEYLGARAGWGVYLLGSLSQADTSRIWAICIVIIGISGLIATLVLRLEQMARERYGETESSDDSLLIVEAFKITDVVVLLAAVMAFWQLFSFIEGANSPVLIGPFSLFERVIDQPDKLSTVLTATIPTALAAIAGLVISTLIAVAWASSSKGQLSRAFLNTTLLPLQYVPIIAAVPLLAVVFGRSSTVTLVVVVLATVFPLYTTIQLHLESVPRTLRDISSFYGASRSSRLRNIDGYWLVLGSIRGVRAAAPRAILGAVLCEALITAQGIGWFVFYARGRMQFDLLWLALVVIVLASLCAEFLLRHIEGRFASGLMANEAFPPHK